MTRICIIGNSHVAALKLAYDNQDSAREFSFYAVPGAGAPNLQVVKQKLFPIYGPDDGVTYPANLNEGEWVRSNIKDAEICGVSLQDYDVIFYVGAGLPALRTTLKNSHHHMNVNNNHISSSSTMVSESCYKAILRSELDITGNIKTLKRILENFNGRIFISLAPVPSRSVLEQSDFPKTLAKPEEFLSWCYELQKDYIEEKFINNDNVQWLYNDCLFSPRWTFTDKKYATLKDAWHMNERYGAEILSRINSKLQKLQG